MTEADLLEPSLSHSCVAHSYPSAANDAVRLIAAWVWWSLSIFSTHRLCVWIPAILAATTLSCYHFLQQFSHWRYRFQLPRLHLNCLGSVEQWHPWEISLDLYHLSQICLHNILHLGEHHRRNLLQCKMLSLSLVINLNHGLITGPKPATPLPQTKSRSGPSRHTPTPSWNQ